MTTELIVHSTFNSRRAAAPRWLIRPESVACAPIKPDKPRAGARRPRPPELLHLHPRCRAWRLTISSCARLRVTGLAWGDDMWSRTSTARTLNLRAVAAVGPQFFYVLSHARSMALRSAAAARAPLQCWPSHASQAALSAIHSPINTRFASAPHTRDSLHHVPCAQGPDLCACVICFAGTLSFCSSHSLKPFTQGQAARSRNPLKVSSLSLQLLLTYAACIRCLFEPLSLKPLAQAPIHSSSS